MPRSRADFYYCIHSLRRFIYKRWRPISYQTAGFTMPPRPLHRRAALPAALALTLAAPLAQGQTPAAPDAAWRRCAALGDDGARLACFDQWAGQQA
jgi:hypothetical protein